MSNTFGIVGWNVYTPNQFVSQAALEEFDGIPAGKYTKGLGQQQMGFADCNEDIVSMMLTAVHGLLEKSGIDASEVGRLEVGTETLIDKSKATKTSLMRLFGDNSDIEGVDTINACYGGTNALLNSLAWLHTPACEGRYAIVVCGDIAVYESGPARPTGGAGVVAFLLGPDAPIRLDLSRPRATHMEDAYDFYKPNLISEYPVVDGHLSNSCYLRAVDKCFETMNRKHIAKDGQPLDITSYQHILFHQPYQKLVQKSYSRYLWNQHKVTGAYSELDEFLKLTDEETYTSRELQKAADALGKDGYLEKVAPSTHFGCRVGNTYTGSLYCALVSLVDQHGSDLDNDKAMLFSYGSGLAATMFEASFTNENDGLTKLRDMANIQDLLGSRVEVTPEEYTAALDRRRASYGQFPLDVRAPLASNLRKGAYSLKSVDELGRRQFTRKFSTFARAALRRLPR